MEGSAREEASRQPSHAMPPPQPPPLPPPYCPSLAAGWAPRHVSSELVSLMRRNNPEMSLDVLPLKRKRSSRIEVFHVLSSGLGNQVNLWPEGPPHWLGLRPTAPCSSTHPNDDDEQQQPSASTEEGGGGGAADGAVTNPDESLRQEIRIEIDSVPRGGGADDEKSRWICRVHPSIREKEGHAYEPKLVSIGPLHHGKRRLQPMEATKRRSRHKPDLRKQIPCAADLDMSGVKFRRKVLRRSSSSSMQEHMISFRRREGVLEIPLVAVGQTLNTRLRNFIALEQCHQPDDLIPCHCAAYVSFMNSIIYTPADVALLRKYGVMEISFGSDEDVAKMFKSIYEDTNLYKIEIKEISQLSEEVNAYCDVAYHRWRGRLRSSYLRSPWSAVALLAAIIMLALTAIQTIFTIRQSYK